MPILYKQYAHGNGTMGYVVDFWKSKEGKIQYVICEFDDVESGSDMRAKFAVQLKKKGYPDATPVHRKDFDYSLGNPKKQHSVKVNCLQFPLKQALAINVHKTQGISVKAPTALVGDMDSCFQAAMVYVMLSRIQNFGQLYLRSFNPEKITVWPEALREAKKIRENSLASPTNMAKNSWNFTSPSLLR